VSYSSIEVTGFFPRKRDFFIPCMYKAFLRKSDIFEGGIFSGCSFFTVCFILAAWCCKNVFFFSQKWM
jgi:hypothetical protein